MYKFNILSTELNMNLVSNGRVMHVGNANGMSINNLVHK